MKKIFVTMNFMFLIINCYSQKILIEDFIVNIIPTLPNNGLGVNLYYLNHGELPIDSHDTIINDFNLINCYGYDKLINEINLPKNKRKDRMILTIKLDSLGGEGLLYFKARLYIINSQTFGRKLKVFGYNGEWTVIYKFEPYLSKWVIIRY